MKYSFEMLHHSLPKLEHLRIFRCLCYPSMKPYRTNKLDSKTTECIFLGYATQYKGYICFSLKDHKLLMSRHVILMNSGFIHSLMSCFTLLKLIMVSLLPQDLLCIQIHSHIQLVFPQHFPLLVHHTPLLLPLDLSMLLNPHLLTIVLVILFLHPQMLVLLQRSYLLCTQKLIQILECLRLMIYNQCVLLHITVIQCKSGLSLGLLEIKCSLFK